MKNRKLLIAAIMCFAISVQTFTLSARSFSMVNYTTQNSINFVENGITFSVFQNGEFDFYLNNYAQGLSINYNSPNVSISFNSGYNYDAFVQYDQFGAVIQIENTPIYYDHYGRITQVGRVHINYNGGRLVRVGGLHLHYNIYGHFAHHTGYINHYNRYYTYHPHHNWFIPPYASYTVVRTVPYRHHYKPHRYHYYKDHRYAYKHKRHHGHHSHKRKIHHDKYKHGKPHKSTYASHDYRRKESTVQRISPSSSQRYASKGKATHGTSKTMNKRSTVYNEASSKHRNKKNVSQQGRKTTIDRSKYSPSRAKMTANYRRDPKRAITKIDQRSQKSKAPSKSSYSQPARRSTSSKAQVKKSVNQRPKTTYVKTAKQSKVVTKRGQSKRTRP